MRDLRVKWAACAAAVLAAGVLLGGGCTGYRLGSMLPPGIDTIFVVTFENRTDQPLIEAETTASTIARFQRDGSLRVAASAETADAVLRVVLEEYTLAPLAFDDVRTTSATEYRATIRARFVLTERATDTVIVDSPAVYGEASFDLRGDLSSSKRDVLPEVSEDLARNIVEQVVETW